MLRSPPAALILSFLGRVFVNQNASGIASGLADQDDDERLGLDSFPRPALAHRGEWAAPDRAGLRKFYPPGLDEAHFD